jgi:tetratricopeptide (TPR) repeat protein
MNKFQVFLNGYTLEEVNTMKRKSVYLTFLIGLLALTVLISLSAPLMAQATTDNKESKQTARPAKKKVEPVKNADYWFDRGALCATYGNDAAAVTYFQKVIKLDPKRSGAYFGQGVSYGQLGQYEKALPLIDKAIEMEPQNGLFFYGRARVHLLAGDEEKAMTDFKKAAELDDEDAQSYLATIAQNQ